MSSPPRVRRELVSCFLLDLSRRAGVCFGSQGDCSKTRHGDKNILPRKIWHPRPNCSYRSIPCPSKALINCIFAGANRWPLYYPAFHESTSSSSCCHARPSSLWLILFSLDRKTLCLPTNRSRRFLPLATVWLVCLSLKRSLRTRSRRCWAFCPSSFHPNTPESWHGEFQDSCKTQSIEDRRGRVKFRERARNERWLYGLIAGNSDILPAVVDLIGDPVAPHVSGSYLRFFQRRCSP